MRELILLSVLSVCFATGGRAACVCGTVDTITRNACIDPHPTGFVGKGSDHLQLIKFWQSADPEKVVCGGANISGSALL